jgi:hypothetical protein
MKDATIRKPVFKSANSTPRQLLQSVLARTLSLAPVIASPLSQVGVLADYATWKRARLARKGKPFFTHRERLWNVVLPKLRERPQLAALEFGVAWGYATRWWLSRLPDAALQWHGFDTFTGLPTTWDRAGLTIYDAGSFSAQGNTPPIADPRVRWHVGDVGVTVTEIDWNELGERPLFLFLDFDLYEPTRIALEAALPHLKRGDVLYFDEAFDAWNERKAIDELLLPAFEVECLGSTATALALEIVNRRPG